MIDVIRFLFHAPVAEDDAVLRERERAAEEHAQKNFRAMQSVRLVIDRRENSDQRSLADVLNRIDDDDQAMKEALGG